MEARQHRAAGAVGEHGDHARAADPLVHLITGGGQARGDDACGAVFGVRQFGVLVQVAIQVFDRCAYAVEALEDGRG